MAAKKNNTVELLRFIYAIIIVVFHFGQKNYINGFGSNGYLGVEFFFLVSGWFMAGNALKHDALELGQATFSYTVKKIATFAIPYYICWFGSYLISNLIAHSSLKEFAFNFLRSIPEALLLRSTGMQMICYISQAWYISAMLLTVVLCYPLICKLKNLYIYCIAPLLAVFVLALISLKSGTLADVDLLIGIFTKGFLRGLAVMNLGVFMYGLGQKIYNITLTKAGKTIVSCIEIFLITTLLLYSILPLNLGIDFVFCLIFAIGLLIILSSETYLENVLSKGSCIIGKMGKLSLYIYLVPAITNSIASLLVKYIHSNVISCVIYVVIVIVSAIVLEIVTAYIQKRLYKIKALIIQG